ncbi:MAG: ATP-binding cassette domain-containing protein [Deltaproteobacteria bacterium]|nr:ATP-binding cassette domain-containing protein [Deltaproteobacteria bacterium]
MSKPILYEIIDLSQYYGSHRALHIERLALEEGAIIGLTGPNGSGKSTLLKILGFIEKPTEGILRFKGKPADLKDESLRSSVTMLFQDPYLLRRSVFENVAFGLRVRHDTNQLTARVHRALQWVGLSPERFARRAWHELSGGEAQRVALASRLVIKPKVLLLDEPTASVDAASASMINDASLMARNEWGATLVISTHDSLWLHALADETLGLYDGRLVGSGAKNYILGPWKPGEEGLWEKTLSEGRRLLALPAPYPDAVAVLDASDIRISPTPLEASPGDTVLLGSITQMIIENGTSRLLVKLASKESSFTSRIARDQATKAGLHPGQPVWFVFNADDFQWF